MKKLTKTERYAQIIGAEVDVQYYHDQRTFSAHINRAETLEGGLLTSAWGRGKTPEEALDAYWQEIAGKKLVINAYRSNRQEFNVPVDL